MFENLEFSIDNSEILTYNKNNTRNTDKGGGFMTTSENIKRKLSKLDKPQFIIAQEIGYSPSRLSGILNGRTPIYDTDIENFCVYLNCTPNDLIVIPPKKV